MAPVFDRHDFDLRIGGVSGLIFAVIGAASIVAGGLTAAATGPLGWSHGSWAAAYLILVTGAAQIVLGIGQDRLARRRVATRTMVGELIGLNLGSAAVIAGTLAGLEWVVDVGGLLILIALVILLITVRRARNSLFAGIFRLVTALLIISIPIGLVLAYVDLGA